MNGLVAAMMPKAAQTVSEVYLTVTGFAALVVPWVWPRLWFRRKGIPWNQRISPRYLWFWWRRLIGLFVALFVAFPIALRVLVPQTPPAALRPLAGVFACFMIFTEGVAILVVYMNLETTGWYGPSKVTKRIRQLGHRVLLAAAGVAICAGIIIGVVAGRTGW